MRAFIDVAGVNFYPGIRVYFGVEVRIERTSPFKQTVLVIFWTRPLRIIPHKKEPICFCPTPRVPKTCPRGKYALFYEGAGTEPLIKISEINRPGTNKHYIATFLLDCKTVEKIRYGILQKKKKTNTYINFLYSHLLCVKCSQYKYFEFDNFHKITLESKEAKLHVCNKTFSYDFFFISVLTCIKQF